MSGKRAGRAQRPRTIEGPLRAAGAGALAACRFNADWRERAQAVIFILRATGPRRRAMASFLVDLWCAGVKDAWGRLSVTRPKFELVVDEMNARMDDTIVEGELAEAQAIVAGGIRFAKQNGFRLPDELDPWLPLLGPVDVEHADLTHFGIEGGKLRWVGPMWDLEDRLIGQPVDEFLARTDVEAFTDVEDDEDWMDDPLMRQAVEQAIEEIIPRATDAVRRWCFAAGVTPAERLDEAVAMLLRQMVELRIPRDIESGDEAEPRLAAASAQAMAQVLESVPAKDRVKMGAAIEQVMRFVEQFKTPEEALDAMGFSPPSS